MSVKISGLVWDSELPRDLKFIALANADHANHDGASVYPGRDSVARMTGYSRRSVELITAQLVRLGILIPDGVSELQTKRYKFDLAALANYRSPLHGKNGGGEESSGAKITRGGGEEKRTAGGEESSGKPSERKPLQQSVRQDTLFPKETSDKTCQFLSGQPGFDEEWRAFKKHRAKLRAPMTERAEELILETLAERPHDAVEALRVAQKKGWRGFEWEWFDKYKQREGKGKSATGTDYQNLTPENAV